MAEVEFKIVSRICSICQKDIPPEFQLESIEDEEDGHSHLAVGVRRITRGSVEWKERIIPILEEQLSKLRDEA